MTEPSQGPSQGPEHRGISQKFSARRQIKSRVWPMEVEILKVDAEARPKHFLGEGASSSLQLGNVSGEASASTFRFSTSFGRALDFDLVSGR